MPGLGSLPSEKNSFVELQYKDSLGRSLIAENRILPITGFNMDFSMGPPRFANLSDTVTCSYVRTEGDRRTRRGTQCVDAISAGCS